MTDQYQDVRDTPPSVGGDERDGVAVSRHSRSPAPARAWAALIYQHTNRDADHGIADSMDKAVKAARRERASGSPSRPPRARNRPPRRADGPLMAQPCFSMT